MEPLLEEFQKIVLKNWNTEFFEDCQKNWVCQLWGQFYLKLTTEGETINTEVVFPGGKIKLTQKDKKSFEEFVSNDLKEMIRPSNITFN